MRRNRKSVHSSPWKGSWCRSPRTGLLQAESAFHRSHARARETHESVRSSAVCEITAGATKVATRSEPFVTTILTLRSSKVVAYWRRAISSNWGCFHLPGVDSCSPRADGVAGAELGVRGVIGAVPCVDRASWLMAGRCWAVVVLFTWSRRQYSSIAATGVVGRDELCI
jgi:hypothetical protein